MKLRLHYIFPDVEAPLISTNIDPEAPFFTTWLYSMIDLNPGAIWFYTVESTDIWDDYDYGNYDLSNVTVLERYKGYTITTRLGGNTGCRVMLPYGQGLLNFAPSMFHAHELIASHMRTLDLDRIVK